MRGINGHYEVATSKSEMRGMNEEMSEGGSFYSLGRGWVGLGLGLIKNLSIKIINKINN
jgi:hypothetical protein